VGTVVQDDPGIPRGGVRPLRHDGDVEGEQGQERCDAGEASHGSYGGKGEKSALRAGKGRQQG
jgi:hypothetical protein